jgi:multidrug efflux pump subunit AcrB
MIGRPHHAVGPGRPDERRHQDRHPPPRARLGDLRRAALLGIVAGTRLPSPIFPRSNFPAVTIATSDPGAHGQTIEHFSGQSAEQLYNTVTTIAQTRLQLVDGVGQITLSGGIEANAQISLERG